MKSFSWLILMNAKSENKIEWSEWKSPNSDTNIKEWLKFVFSHYFSFSRRKKHRRPPFWALDKILSRIFFFFCFFSLQFLIYFWSSKWKWEISDGKFTDKCDTNWGLINREIYKMIIERKLCEIHGKCKLRDRQNSTENILNFSSH